LAGIDMDLAGLKPAAHANFGGHHILRRQDAAAGILRLNSAGGGKDQGTSPG
jgi:hypothetical protein